MNTKAFLDKYYGLLREINNVEPVYTMDKFYSLIYDKLFVYMAEYYNFITEYSDETPGAYAIQAMHRLIKKLKLPVKEFKIPERSLHIFYKEDT
jgi:hypothetical protein